MCSFAACWSLPDSPATLGMHSLLPPLGRPPGRSLVRPGCAHHPALRYRAQNVAGREFAPSSLRNEIRSTEERVLGGAPKAEMNEGSTVDRACAAAQAAASTAVVRT
jgi:hypothetical protein